MAEARNTPKFWQAELDRHRKNYAQRRLMWHEEYRKLLRARKIDAALAFGPLGRLVRPTKYDPEEAKVWVDEMMERDANAVLYRRMMESAQRMLSMFEEEASSKTQSTESQSKTCPFCAETIKLEAIVCRYCGRDLPAS